MPTPPQSKPDYKVWAYFYQAHPDRDGYDTFAVGWGYKLYTGEWRDGYTTENHARLAAEFALRAKRGVM